MPLPRLPFLRLACLALLALPASGPAAALGGREAEGALARHMVMVLSSRGGACSGIVVGRRTVLTAGHCASGGGDFAVHWREGGEPVLKPVQAVALHPEFSRGARVSIDLALVRVGEALPPLFAPAQLDDGGVPHVLDVARTLAGFGLTAGGGPKSGGTLRSGEARVLPRLFPRYIRLGGPAVCTGDSGGGVFAAGPVLVGLIYAREGAGRDGCSSAAQAVRIAPQRAWIEGTLQRLEAR